MSKTILITRPKGDELELTEALQAQGHHVIHEPLTEIFLNHTIRTPLAAMLIEREPNAIILTSKHAVQALALLSDIRDISLLCVGATTADIALSNGFTRVENAGGTVDHLVDYIQGGYDDEAHFVYISGEHTHTDLPNILASFGMQCEHIIAYKAIAAETLSDTLLAQLERQQIDAVTFFSERNARIFLDLVARSQLGESFKTMDVFTLSANIARTCEEAPWRSVHHADKPTLASLVDCVDNTYA